MESAGIGLVFGLRYYGNGVLKENELVIYVQVKKISYFLLNL